MSKNSDHSEFINFFLVFVAPVLVIGLPILIMGAAPVEAWIAVGVVVAFLTTLTVFVSKN